MDRKIILLAALLLSVPISSAAPLINTFSPLNTTYGTTSIPLSWSANETLAWVAYSINSGINITLNSTLLEYIETGTGSYASSGPWVSVGVIDDGSVTTSTSCGSYGTGVECEYYRNFTIYSGIDAMGSLMRVVYRNCAGGTFTLYDTNFSVDSNCWKQPLFQLKIWAGAWYLASPHIDQANLSYYCWDGSVWNQFYDFDSTCGGASTGVREIAVYENNTRQRNITLVATANIQNSVIVYGNNSGGALSSNTTYFTVDTISPDIIVTSPQNTSYSSTNISLMWSTLETVNWTGYSLNGAANITLMANTTFIGNEGGDTLLFSSNDSLGNVNSSTIYFTIDTSIPFWSSNSSDIPSFYNSSRDILFNITWNDTTTHASTVYIETNLTGSPKNETMSVYTGKIYNFTAKCPIASDYYWKSCVNDTAGNVNCTDTWLFSIADASTTTSVYINGTLNSDRSFSEGQSWNITAYSTTADVNTTIMVDSILKAYGMGNATFVSTPTVGTYNITAISLGNENYTSSFRTQTVIITSVEIPTYSDIETEYASPFTFNYSVINQMFNITWSWNSTLSNLSSVILEWNGTNITVMDNRSISADNAEFYYNLTGGLKAGTFSYTWYARNGVGNLGVTSTQTYVVSQKSPISLMSLTAGSWSLYSGDSGVFSGSESNNGDESCTYQLLMNGAVKSNPYNIVLPTGIYTFNYTTSGCTNYTDGSVIHDATVIPVPVTPPSGGTGGTIYISGNWSVLQSDYYIFMSPGDSYTQPMTIDNRQSEEIRTVSLTCIPCGEEDCFNLCPYITFGNLSYTEGAPLSIPQGQSGQIPFYLDFREEYLVLKNLTQPGAGTYEFSIAVTIDKTTRPLNVKVTVLPGIGIIGVGIDWISGSSVLFPANTFGEFPILIPNWIILVFALMAGIIGFFVVLKWALGGPKKTTRFPSYTRR